jgi:uncharacterized protein (TIGR00645 family)
MKIGVVGSGMVGGAAAFAAVMTGAASEIILIDVLSLERCSRAVARTTVVGLIVLAIAGFETMIRRWFENLLLGSRWLLAGLFIVLSISLLALLARSVETLYVVGLTVISGSEEILIVEILKLIDLTLTGFLVVILIVSGFVNFLGRIDLTNHPLPAWMMHIGFSGSKLWLLTSVIARIGLFSTERRAAAGGGGASGPRSKNLKSASMRAACRLLDPKRAPP